MNAVTLVKTPPMTPRWIPRAFLYPRSNVSHLSSLRSGHTPHLQGGVACVLAGLILQIACPLATAAAGDSSNEIDAIRNEMQQLQEDYNRRMELLDERLRKLERTEDGPEVTASEPEMGAESEPEMPK